MMATGLASHSPHSYTVTPSAKLQRMLGIGSLDPSTTGPKMMQSPSFAANEQSGLKTGLSIGPVEGIQKSTKIQEELTKAQNTGDLSTQFATLERITTQYPLNKELCDFYVDLLSDIFGYGNRPGWGLRNVEPKSYYGETSFRRIFNFLCADGYLFRLSERLMMQQTIFEFPTSCLPQSIRSSFQKGIVPAFYQDKVTLLSRNQIGPMIRLNPLEYYLFMYAYYIVHPNVKKDQTQWSKYGDGLYIALFENYLNYFLPTDGSSISPSSLSSLTTGTSPSANIYQDSGSRYHESQIFSRASGSMSSYLPQQRSPSSGSRMNIFTSNVSLDPFKRPTWKSEAFVQIITDFWLGQNSAESNQSYARTVQEYFLPTQDHARMVRMFVKHIHAFTGSGVHPHGTRSFHRIGSDNPTEEFRRMLLPSIIQRRLYLFLKHCFSHWPLDPSFRMVLETWLSYIQPWRYKESDNGHDDSKNLQVDLGHWKSFISENLLFYTVLFRMFLPRAMRFDLLSTKDVQLIYRVSKVFSQSNLTTVLEEVEKEAVGSGSSTTSLRTLSSTRLSPSYLSLRPSFIGIEIEEPGFQYEPIFDGIFSQQVEELASKLSETLIHIRTEEQMKRQDLTRGKKPNLLTRVKQFFVFEFRPEEDQHDETLTDYLEKSCNQLAFIFMLRPLPTAPDAASLSTPPGTPGLPKPRSPETRNLDGQLSPEFIATEDGLQLTERGRYQIVNGLRRFDIQYSGDPELQPIRSFESATIVRWMYGLSVRINEKYGQRLKEYYNRRDLVGSSLRYISTELNSKPGSPYRLPDYEPRGEVNPRISLRFLGSYYVLGYLCWLVILTKLFGFNFLAIMLLFMLAVILAVLVHVGPIPEKDKKRS